MPRNLDDPKVYAEAEKHFGRMIFSSARDLREQQDRLEEMQSAMTHASHVFEAIWLEDITPVAAMAAKGKETTNANE